MKADLRVVLLVLLGVSLSLTAIDALAYPVYLTTQQALQLPFSLYGTAAVYLNGSIYLIGGTAGNGTEVNSVLVYSNGQWTYSYPLPFRLSYAMAVVYNNTILVIGGLNSSGISPYVLELTGSGWRILSSSMPVPVYGGMAFVYKGKVYVVGGYNGTGAETYFPPSNKIQVFDPKTGSWSVVGYTPVPLAESDYYFNGSALFVAGGYEGYNVFTSSAFLYYPETNTWVNLPSAPGGLAGGSVAYVNGIYVVVGGLFLHQGYNSPGAVLVFNGTGWYISTQKENVSTKFAGSVQVGDKLYIFGGLSTNNLATRAVQVISFHFPPLIPTITSIRPINGGFVVNWTNVNATGYIIYVYYNGSILTTYTVGGITSAVVTGLQNGLTYSVRIQAYNAYGFSPLSAPVEVTPLASPPKPKVTVTIGNSNVTVRWAENAYNTPIEGFYLILANASGIIKSLTLPPSVNSYVFTDLKPGSKYIVEVIAFNQAGNSTPGVSEFYALGLPEVNITIAKDVNGFTATWNSTFPANFTVLVYEGGKLLVNQSLGGKNQFTYKGQFGIYNLTVIATNQAGTTVKSVKVVYYLPPSAPQVHVVITPKGLEFNVSSKYALNYTVYYGDLLLNSSNKSVILIQNPILNGKSLYKIVASNPGGSNFTLVNVTLNTLSYQQTVKVYEGFALNNGLQFKIPSISVAVALGIVIALGALIGFIAATRS